MQTLSEATRALNRIKWRANATIGLVLLLRSLLVGLLLINIWSIVRPEAVAAHLTLGLLGFATALAGCFSGRRRHLISVKDVALALEMADTAATTSPLDTTDPDRQVDDGWRERFRQALRDLKRFERQRLAALAGSLALPAAAAFFALPSAAPAIGLAITSVQNAVSTLTRGATLKVVTGATQEKYTKTVPLKSGEPLKIELMAQNLVEVTVNGGGFGKAVPTVELRRVTPPESGATAPAGEATTQPAPAAPAIFQSFQLIPVRDATELTADAEATRHAISFAVAEELDLHIPALDDKPLAHLIVRLPPIPKVKLTLTGNPEDPWPDDQPLPLRIQVKAENPLDSVRLLIKSGTRISKELVANVMSENKTELSTDYRLLLEPYVDSDLAQVEIVAEAIDRAVPTPLVGLSEPLRLNTASAYGRYRQALQTLGELKQLVDDAVAKQQKQLPPEAKGLADKAQVQSEKSPFFDGLDRVQMGRFQAKVAEIAQQPDIEKVLDLSGQLNDFLFEHEILDDRERDRDFFVAARGLSRLIEQDPARRPVPLKTVTERIRKFLDDRHERWKRRTSRLPPDNLPEKWPEVRDQRPFNKTVERIEAIEDQAGKRPDAKSDQLTDLSKAVVEYRAWIEQLEAAEDKARDQQDRERQEGLANARDTLRELQKKQGEISSELDRAGQRTKSDMEGQWPTTRMKQNANERDTRRLENQLRSLSPGAAGRIQAALEAMEGVTEAGNGQNFAQAESDSDLAGRMLRQADSAAQQSQQKRKARGRRRRVTGDNYYGQSVVGGDVEIKREYQVDRRYREDILDEVQSAGVDEENRTFLESYLRQVVR